VQLDRLNESGTFDVVSPLQNAKGVQTAQVTSDVPASYLLDNYVSKTGQNGFGRLPDDADIGILYSDGLRITRVVDTSINRLTIDVTSGSSRLRVLKLVTSERWKAANIRMNESVLFSMQVGDELHILMPPFVGATKLEVQALHSAASSYVFLYPLFGMMDWQNDVSVIGPGSSR
jgi:hypothetical protein